MLQCQTQSLCELARAIAQVITAASPLLHGVGAGDGFARPQQHRSGVTLFSRDDVHHHVYPVTPVHVEVTGSEKHRGVSFCPAPVCV